MKKILVIDPDDQGRFFLSVSGGALSIGNSAAHAEVALRDLKVVRIRCEVEVTEEPALVAAQAGAPTKRWELHAGQEIQLGHAHLRMEPVVALAESESGVRALDETLPTTLGATPSPAPRSGVRAADLSTALQLKVIDGADHKQVFNLPASGRVTIGNSGKHADICLHDLYVSRVHCLVEVDGDKIWITHSEGKNGTLINGERITDRQELHVGDILRVGNSHLRLEVGNEAGAQVVSVQPRSGASKHAQAATAEMTGLEGQEVANFRIEMLLGEGHSGRVFRAVNLKNNQPVALKILAPEFPAASAELQQLGVALKAATPLRHVNLVSLLGAGKNGPHCWIAREFIEGESIATLVERLKEEERLTWTRAVRVAVHLANALTFLHERKTVHGNITPRNVLVSKADKVTKLGDLMLAPGIRGSKLQKRIAEQKLLAELPFMAPEQVDKDAFVDRLADLYALGAVVYLLATGEPPFTGKTADEIIANIRETPVARPTRYQRKLPFSFEGVILKLLAKRQEDRYQTATELLADLDFLVREHQINV